MTTTDLGVDGDEYIQHQIFSILSSLLWLLASFPQPTPYHIPKEREAIVSEQSQHSFGRAEQSQQPKLRKRVAPSTWGLLLFAWGTEILSHLMLHSEKLPPPAHDVGSISL